MWKNNIKYLFTIFVFHCKINIYNYETLEVCYMKKINYDKYSHEINLEETDKNNSWVSKTSTTLQVFIEKNAV